MMTKLKRSNYDTETRRLSNTAKLSDLFQPAIAFVISLFALLNLGCQPNQTILKDAAPPPTPMSTVEQKRTSFEQDLREMETANFDYIFAFRRNDGGIFDKEDKKYLRDNTPIETNRWRESDDGKAFIAGSGFGFSPENMDALQKRFIVEDHSKPEIKEAANKAANTETNKVISNKTEKPQVNK